MNSHRDRFAGPRRFSGGMGQIIPPSLGEVSPQFTGADSPRPPLENCLTSRRDDQPRSPWSRLGWPVPGGTGHTFSPIALINSSALLLATTPGLMM